MEKDIPTPDRSPGKRKRVLFLSATDYDITKNDATLEKKISNLAQAMDVFVLARGDGWGIKKYQAEWFLVKRRWGKIGMIFWGKLGFCKALRIIKEKQIDTIVAQSPALDGYISAWLKIFTRKELIIEAHGDWINSLFFYSKEFGDR